MGKVTKLDSEFKPFLSKDLVHVRKPLIKPEMVDGFRSNSL